MNKTGKTGKTGKSITKNKDYQEEYFRKLVEVSPDAIAIHCEGRIVYANTSAATLIGADSPEELLGKPVMEFVHSEEREFIRKRITEIFNGDKGQKIEERFLKLDGSVIEVEVVSTVIQFELKPAMLVIIRDITERKAAEIALRESEEKYRNLVDNAHESIVIIQDETIKYANNRTAEFLGKEPKEVLALSLQDFIYAEDLPAVIENHKRRLEGLHVPDRYTIRIFNYSGNIRWVNISGVVIEWNGRPATLIFLSDITEQRQAEQDLLKSELLNTNLVKHIPQRIFIKDIKSRYLFCNENYARDLGIRPEEIIGRNDNDFFPADYVEKYQADDQRVVKGGIALNMVERYMIAGQPRWTRVKKTPYHNSENEVIGVLGIFEDFTEQKQAEEALRESEERFRKVFYTSPESITINELNTGIYIEVNEGFCKQLGYSREETIGRSTLELKTWSDMADREYFLKNINEFGVIRNFVSKFRRKDGEIIDVMMSASIISLNNTPHIITMSHDITDLKQSEKSLTLFRTLIDQSSDCIEVVDPDSGKILDINEKTCQDLGYTKEELLSMHIFEIDPTINKEEFSSSVENLRKDKTILFEAIHRRKDGTDYPVEVNLKLVSLDREYLVADVRDIRERKLAEQSIKLQIAALQAAANAIVITDDKGTIIWVNKALAALTGYRAGDALGKNPRDLFKSGMHSREFYQDMWATMSKGNIWHGELVNRKKDGSLYHEEMTVTPLLNEKGEITHFIAIKQDISERIRAEEQIKNLNNDLENRIVERTRELENSLQELESFSYSISHDLRAPLRSMNSYARILEDEFSDQLNKEAKRYLSVIHHNALKMGSLIDDLLSFSRFGRKELNRTLIDMNFTVRSIIKEINENQDHKAKINTHELLPAFGDSILINQVWANLISNAIKYSSKKEQPEIEIGSYKDDSELIYFVRDNGAGFDMKYSHKLFGVFQRLHSENDFQGTGIGLAIVKRIVNRHNGRVWAESKVNEGSTFYFTLPVNNGINKGILPVKDNL